MIGAFLLAIEWSTSGPESRAWASVPLIGSLFFLGQAACLAALLIKLVSEPRRYADRMAGALCLLTGIDIVFVMCQPTLVTDRLVASLALVSLAATAMALGRLEHISQRHRRHGHDADADPSNTPKVRRDGKRLVAQHPEHVPRVEGPAVYRRMFTSCLQGLLRPVRSMRGLLICGNRIR